MGQLRFTGLAALLNHELVIASQEGKIKKKLFYRLQNLF